MDRIPNCVRGGFSGKLTAAVGLTAALLLALHVPARASTVEPLTVEETVAAAGPIFSGRVVSSHTRWGDTSHRWMVTEVGVAVDDVILGDGRVQRNRTVLLSFWGGSIGGERQAVADLEIPEVGSSYVWMLRPDWRTPSYSPAVALHKGLFPVAADASGRLMVKESEGTALVKMADGRIMRRTDAAYVKGEPGVPLAAFKEWLRANVHRIKAAPPAPRHRAPAGDPHLMTPVAKVGLLPGEAIPAGVERGDPTPTLPAAPPTPDGMDPPAPAGGAPVAQHPTGAAAVRGPVQRADAPSGGVSVQYSTFGTQPIFDVINQLPASLAPWSPEDQYQMSKWNFFSDIIRVYATPRGYYAWPDNVNDIDGFPPNSDMQRVYGYTWGSGTIGITFYRTSGSTILEADVALNPYYSWTLDDEWVYNGGGAMAYRATMTHELGHEHGMNHQFNFLSVMNYSPGVYRMFGFPYMDDAEAIRANYPSRAAVRTDLAVYLYYSTGYQSWSDASFPGSVLAGDSFFINNYHVENAGTTTIGNPTLEWYLSLYRNYSSYYYLTTVSYNTSLPRFTYYNPSSVGVYLPVPLGIPGGDYYVNAFVRGDSSPGQGSFPFGNDRAWSRVTIRVISRLNSLSVSSGVDGGSNGSGTVYLGSAAGPGGVTVYLGSDSAAASVPFSVFVPQGNSSASFTITTTHVNDPVNATISASSNGITKYAVIRVRADSSIVASGDSGTAGDTVLLSAVLSRPVDAVGLVGKTVYFYVDGTYVGYGITDSTGTATLSYVIPDTLATGDHPVTAWFTGDNDYSSAIDGSAVLTVY